MTEHACEQCGAENAPDAQFCVKCDFYLGWDTRGSTLGNAPLTSSQPVVRETHSQKFPVVSVDRPQRRPDPQPARRPSSSGRQAEAPTVTLETEEVVVHPDEGGTFDVRIHNSSSIVDGYTVEAAKAPPWLTITHPEIRVLTDEEQLTTVTLGIRPEFSVYVQRFHLPVQIRSVENSAVYAEVNLVVVIPRIGGPVTMTPEPHVVRMRDQTAGRFRIHLDNKESNYPQRYQLDGSDPEGVVRFTFRPHIVECPPLRVSTVEVRFEAPAPEVGQQANRTLNITAANDENKVEAVVNVAQLTSAAPPDSPVRLRLEPSVTRVADSTTAEVSVMIDNSRGSKDRQLRFAGRDPERKIRFAFAQQQVFVRAGKQARVGVRVNAPLPDQGEEMERQFAVVCHDGKDESEATGSIVQFASASPITTAQIRLDPQHVVVRNSSRGRAMVTVDNSRGGLPLSVWLSGSDPEGAVQFEFAPPRIDMPARGYGQAWLRLRADLPGNAKAVDREIKVIAADQSGRIEADGRFSQSMSDLWPILRIVLTLVGGLLVVLGAFLDWFRLVNYKVDKLADLSDRIQGFAQNDPDRMHHIVEAALQPSARALVLVLAGVMMLGILSSKGKITILAGLLTAAAAIAVLVYEQWDLNTIGAHNPEIPWGEPVVGIYLVAVGGVVGIAGGLCARRTN
jgi:hypothetical protein